MSGGVEDPTTSGQEPLRKTSGASSKLKSYISLQQIFTTSIGHGVVTLN